MHKLVRLLLVFFISTLGLFLASQANAESTFSWIGSNLAFKKGAETVSTPTSLNGNIDCQTHSSTICSFPTVYGSSGQGGVVRLNGTNDFRPVFNYIENRQRFLAVPNSSTFITYTVEPPYGFYIYFNYNFGGSITKEFVNGATRYKINRPPDGRLIDKSNKRLAADYTSMNFSQNGRWMVVSMPNVAMLRVDLQTFEVVPFGNGFNYTIGIDPAIKTAISNDGRWAAVSSLGFPSFKIYDLSTCGAVPNTINGPVSCQSRDIKNFLAQQISNYGFSSNLQFIDSNSLAIYATSKAGSILNTSRVVVGSENSIDNQIELLGMGESYISGEGAFNYQGGTDTEDNHCHLSLISYPYLIGRDLGFNSDKSIACSGALTKDILNSSESYRGQAQNKKFERGERKLQEIDLVFASFKPGYVNQSDFVTRYQPEVVLLSIGGNDIGFSKIVTKCGAPWNLATCYASYEDRVELVQEINNQLYPKLVETYQTIKNTGAPNARIYIVGYPQIAKPGGNCAINAHLREDEIIFSEQLISYLNSIIKLATQKAGVFYVDAEDALVGHRLCEAKGGSVAVNGLTVGFDTPFSFGPIANESYHPNELGHQLLENKVLAATSNLMKPMPAANLNVSLPPENGLDILKAPRENRAIYNTQYDESISGDNLQPNSQLTILVSGAQHALKPANEYSIELRSSPIQLGSYNTDSTGNLSAQLQLPADLDSGIHTLHIYGNNIAGDPIDIYKYIYIGSNSQNNCGVLVNEDYDQDGIDDACDGIISEAPKETISQSAPLTTGQNLSQSAPTNDVQNQLQPAVLSVSNQPLNLRVVPVDRPDQYLNQDILLASSSTNQELILTLQDQTSAQPSQSVQLAQAIIITTSSPVPIQSVNDDNSGSQVALIGFADDYNTQKQNAFQKLVVLGAVTTTQQSNLQVKVVVGSIPLAVLGWLGLRKFF